jgi:hypothetical protein
MAPGTSLLIRARWKVAYARSASQCLAEWLTSPLMRAIAAFIAPAQPTEQETLMTLEQMQTEVTSLREAISAMQKKDEARQKNWRSYRFAAAFIGILYLCGSLGLLIAGLVISRPMPLLSAMQYALLFTALPTILLANVLIEPNPDARAQMEAALRRSRES